MLKHTQAWWLSPVVPTIERPVVPGYLTPGQPHVRGCDTLLTHSTKGLGDDSTGLALAVHGDLSVVCGKADMWPVPAIPVLSM